MLNEIINKPTYQMIDWEIKDVGTCFCLLGKLVEKREGFHQGEVVLTSQLVRIDFEKKLAETKNSFYELIN